MGRPTIENLSYFSHDTDMRRDKKVALAMAESEDSLKLFGTYVALLEDVYHNKYFMKFTEEDAILFCQPINDLNLESFWSILATLLKRGLFNKKLYENYDILTSRSIQARWLKACERRKCVSMHKEYVLLDVKSFVENDLSKNYEGKKLDVRIVSTEETHNIDSNKSVSTEETPDTEDNETEKKQLEPYNLQCDYKWKESQDQPIDFEAVLEYWNKVNDAQSRMTDPKKPDIRRAIREYTGIEIARALYVRAKDEHIGKYKSQWSTFFGQTTLVNMDKWVDKAHNLQQKEKKMTTVSEHIKGGWYYEDNAEDIAEKTGMEIEDSVYWKTKDVNNSLLYYPKFDV